MEKGKLKRLFYCKYHFKLGMEGGFQVYGTIYAPGLRVDIRDQFDVLRAELRRVRQTLGPAPLNQTKLDKWNAFYTRSGEYIFSTTKI